MNNKYLLVCLISSLLIGNGCSMKHLNNDNEGIDFSKPCPAGERLGVYTGEEKLGSYGFKSVSCTIPNLAPDAFEGLRHTGFLYYKDQELTNSTFSISPSGRYAAFFTDEWDAPRVMLFDGYAGNNAREIISSRQVRSESGDDIFEEFQWKEDEKLLFVIRTKGKKPLTVKLDN